VSKKAPGFNTPFEALKALQKKAPEPAKKAAPPPPPPKKKAPREPSPDDEAALFHSAMEGVFTVKNRGKPPVAHPAIPQRLDENAEALAQLAQLVSGEGPFDVTETAEAFEGMTEGSDRSVLAALRRGDFPLEGELDLHGRTQLEAKDDVERFLVQSRKEGKRCVLIVHGRGAHSKDQVPVLKKRVSEWLGQKRIGKLVLGFATAQPADGGAGAVYVLLRR